MEKWRVTYYAGILVFLLLLGCGRSSFVQMYEDSYAAYISGDINVAELSLRAFDDYLRKKIESNSTPDDQIHYLDSRIVTNVRLYDIYSYKGDRTSAERVIHVIQELSSGSTLVTEEDVIELINAVQKDANHRPKWKENTPSKGTTP